VLYPISDCTACRWQCRCWAQQCTPTPPPPPPSDSPSLGAWACTCVSFCSDLGAFLLDGTMVHTMSVVTTPGVSASCITADGVRVLNTLFFDSKTNLPSTML
jgi:hypothetical protein